MTITNLAKSLCGLKLSILSWNGRMEKCLAALHELQLEPYNRITNLILVYAMYTVGLNPICGFKSRTLSKVTTENVINER